MHADSSGFELRQRRVSLLRKAGVPGRSVPRVGFSRAESLAGLAQRSAWRGRVASPVPGAMVLAELASEKLPKLPPSFKVRMIQITSLNTS